MLGRQAAVLFHVDEGAVEYAEKRVMGLVRIPAAERHVIGRDERQALGIGKIDQLLLDGRFIGKAVALQFDIDAVAEQIREPVQQHLGGLGLTIGKEAIDRPVRAASEKDQTLGIVSEMLDRGMRKLAGSHLEL